MPASGRTVIAIPVKNEQARIGNCLKALAAQEKDFDGIFLFLNNCTDDSLEICREFSTHFHKLHILQGALEGRHASAGEARRRILNHAAKMAGDGIVLTTDADARPGKSWVADNLRALAQGADGVCGKAELDPSDMAASFGRLQDDERDEARVISIQDEIASIIDPDAADPWPRHQQHSGASLAMRAEILRRAGGAPHVAIGEDRALIALLKTVDARIRHEPGISVHVSGRLDGRAEGGMAATLKRRMAQRDLLTDDRLEASVDAYRRVLAKARLRLVHSGLENPEGFAADMLLDPHWLRARIRTAYFGTAWAEVERRSPMLRRRRVRFCDLAREKLQAAALLDQLRDEISFNPAGAATSLPSGENAV